MPRITQAQKVRGERQRLTMMAKDAEHPEVSSSGRLLDKIGAHLTKELEQVRVSHPFFLTPIFFTPIISLHRMCFHTQFIFTPRVSPRLSHCMVFPPVSHATPPHTL